MKNKIYIDNGEIVVSHTVPDCRIYESKDNVCVNPDESKFIGVERHKLMVKNGKLMLKPKEDAEDHYGKLHDKDLKIQHSLKIKDSSGLKPFDSKRNKPEPEIREVIKTVIKEIPVEVSVDREVIKYKIPLLVHLIYGGIIGFIIIMLIK